MTKEKETGKKKRKAALKQSDVPSMSIAQALRVIKAIAEEYASKPTTPLNVAAALDVQPTTGPFRMLCGASAAYGLSSGSYNSSEIEITELGKRIVTPTVEGDDLIATKEAMLKPRVIGEFLRKYDGSPLPKENIAINVLADMTVPRDRAQETFTLIRDSAESAGLLKKIKERFYVDLKAMPNAINAEDPVEETNSDEKPETKEEYHDESTDIPDVSSIERKSINAETDSRRKKVFITHGKNKQFVEPIKKLLAFGELEPVVSVEKQSVSKPVPEKVMSDMRDCGAAIIHVEDEQKLLDSDANEIVVLKPNVLIEIGAAMGLYGKRFILLVKDGVKLPSNLQGLFEVRYQGETLDGDATIKLLEAINDMKKLPL